MQANITDRNGAADRKSSIDRFQIMRNLLFDSFAEDRRIFTSFARQAHFTDTSASEPTFLSAHEPIAQLQSNSKFDFRFVASYTFSINNTCTCALLCSCARASRRCSS